MQNITTGNSIRDPNTSLRDCTINGGVHTHQHEHQHIDSKAIIQMYARNEVTLCQAVNILRSLYNDLGLNAQMPPLLVLLEFFGHKMAHEDSTQIELGFEGSMGKWFEAGHRPKGWYQLFKDNYHYYLEE